MSVWNINDIGDRDCHKNVSLEETKLQTRLMRDMRFGQRKVIKLQQNTRENVDSIGNIQYVHAGRVKSYLSCRQEKMFLFPFTFAQISVTIMAENAKH